MNQLQIAEAIIFVMIIINDTLKSSRDLNRIEADKYSEADKETRRESSDEWHGIDLGKRINLFVCAQLIVVIFWGIDYEWLLYDVINAFVMVFYFPILHNLRRKLPWYHLGDRGIDGKVKRFINKFKKD